MLPGQPKMSLIAQFDDVCRYVSALEAGFDDTLLCFIKFVSSQEDSRKKWWDVIKSQPKQIVIDNGSREKIQHLKSVVDGLKVDLQNEQKKSAKLEAEVSELNQVLSEVKKLVCGEDAPPEKRNEILEYLSRLPYAEEPKRREESLDCNVLLFDKTDDDLDLLDEVPGSKNRRSSGKRSGRTEENSHTSPKRRKSNEEIVFDCERSSGLVATTTVTIPPSRGRITAQSKIVTIPQVRDRRARSDTEERRDNASTVTPSAPPMRLRSDSGVLPELNHNRYYLDVARSGVSQATPLRGISQSPAPSPSIQCTPIRQCISTSKLTQRLHHFATKTVIRPETCSPCGRKIKFYKQALKCADCRATCHPECKAAVPTPCIPVSQTPTSTTKSSTMTVADFAPVERPMVPALIIHCVNEVESRGLKEIGLYRISGSERDVKELKLKILKGKTMPSFSKIDVHVMCGVLKDFLRSIETLIPRIMWQEFVGVLDISHPADSLSALYHAIKCLPTANRDTLAFLVQHWQRIAEIPDIKMPISSLSSILAPTVIGYSMASLPETTIAEEQVKIQQVMQRILSISSDFWNRILNNQDADNTEVFKTPDARPPPEGNILGPIYGSGTWNLRSRATLGRTPLSPRVVHNGGSLKSRKFFASPVLR